MQTTMQRTLRQAPTAGARALPLPRSRRPVRVAAFQAPANCDLPKNKSAIEELKAKNEAALAAHNKMFCYQCEQTLHGSGCTEVGVCGKTSEVAGLQDLLVYQMKGLGCLAHHARAHGVQDAEVNTFINGAIFSTLTNVNFDDSRFHEFLHEGQRLKEVLSTKMKAAGVAPPPTPDVPEFWGGMPHPLLWNVPKTAGVGDLIAAAPPTYVSVRKAALGDTLAGLQELVVYGLKGMAAYAHHAEALGKTDPTVYAFVAECLAFLAGPGARDVGQVLAMALRVGEVNFTVMQNLSEAHSGTFGHPTPTSVDLAPKPGKAILITGHDMHDLELLLKQTEGKGINVYTHGEMLPAFGYPGLKKYPHLAGHYGGAWYRQKVDFSHFPGSILVTTNCVLDPLESYRANIFTTNETGVKGVRHVPTKDFSAVIKRAMELPGWTPANMPRTASTSSSGGRGAAASAAPAKKAVKVTTGFGHHAVLGVANHVIDAVKSGKLKHIFLMGGCDGHEPQRAYYGQLGEKLPKDTMLLTLGCGKFRVINQDFGMLPGTPLPRLLDMGQCNDAYSALVVATELAKIFNTDVNKLPLSLDLSWFEQKAVAVLLTLLSLGVKNIRLGPVLPAFLTPEALAVLVEKFAIKPADTTNPELDLQKMMQGK
uniref:Hydroxylamine reductase n=1 Tax=Chlamydomonas leiostraca TaxID=1034604 RepID=A0A7S0RFR5_9CHLO|mmetsp:Transcript_20952/g.53249  ORF Transcript_20952/g.53249 Transcript_20952/m.53249 type:complete len:651 (+) Transcript_20952:101-2053(+)